MLCASFETHSLYAPLNKSCEAAVAYLRSESLCTVGVSGDTGGAVVVVGGLSLAG